MRLKDVTEIKSSDHLGIGSGCGVEKVGNASQACSTYTLTGDVYSFVDIFCFVMMMNEMTETFFFQLK